MDADWGGLETLLAAAEFVESQEQKNQKLIEICEEYPGSEKISYAAESASSLTAVQNVAVATSSTVLPATSRSTHFPNETVGSRSPQSVISSTISTLPTLPNGSSSSAAALRTTLPSFSPSPSLTFTFTTASSASQTAPPLLKIPPAPHRLPTTTSSSSPMTSVLSPKSNPSSAPPPLMIQRNNAMSYSPPPLSRTIVHHSQAQQSQLPQQQLQQAPLPQQQQKPLQVTGCVPILPNRTLYPERSAVNVSDKRKLSNSGTREVHNKLEKNRRAHLKECFELLKSQVPAIQDEKKPSNLTILRTAIRYVQILRRREQELETELERLAREKIVNQQRLTTLKKELCAQWDHIDFNSLLPDSVESAKEVVLVENGADHSKYERDQDIDMKISMSDIDDSNSQVKSRCDTYYGSSSPTNSCSISPLHMSSSPNVVSTTSDTLPPQIHIVESPSVSFEKLSNTTVVSPLQFLSTSTLRMITDPEQQIALVQHSGNDRVTEPAALPKMTVHAGNTFTIFSDSFQKVTAATNNPVVTGSGSQTSSSNSKLATGTCVQFTSGLTLPAVPVNHKNITLPVKPGFSPSAPNGTIASSTVGDKGNTSTVLTTVPVHSNVGNLVNHSFVVTQPPSGQMLISTTSPHLPTNIMPTPPLLKTVSRLQSINGHQLMMKPATAAVVVVSSATAASK